MSSASTSSWGGVAIGSATTFTEASGLRPSDGERWGRYHPSDGSLPAAEMAALGGPRTGPRHAGRPRLLLLGRLEAIAVTAQTHLDPGLAG